MRPRWLLIVFGLSVWLSPLWAQSSVLSIGVRGGGQLWSCTPANAETTTLGLGAGGNGVLDLRYSLYGSTAGERVNVGFAVGAGFGYGLTRIKGTHTGTFKNTDYLGNKLNYTTAATFNRAERFATGEVSLLFALGASGFTLHIGPRFMVPFGVKTVQTVTDATIDAYMERLDVTFTNEAITGKLVTPHVVDTFPSVVPPYHLLLAIEAGWEFALSPTNAGRMGVQLYANIGLWSPAVSTQPMGSLVTIEPIEKADKDPKVNVLNSADLIKSRRYLDFGVRLYYAFPVATKKKSLRRAIEGNGAHRNRFLWD